MAIPKTTDSARWGDDPAALAAQSQQVNQPQQATPGTAQQIASGYNPSLDLTTSGGSPLIQQAPTAAARVEEAKAEQQSSLDAALARRQAEQQLASSQPTTTQPTPTMPTFQAPQTPQRISIPSQTIAMPQMTQPTVTREAMQVSIPDVGISIDIPEATKFSDTEIANLTDQAKAISTQIRHTAASQAEKINSALQELANPNEYMQQALGMEFSYDPSQDAEYLRAAQHLENQIHQMMVGRGMAFSSVAQATLQSSMIDLQIAFRGQKHNEFIDQRNFMMQAAQMEEQRRGNYFSQMINAAAFELESLAQQYGQTMGLAEFEFGMQREQWQQQFQVAGLELQRQTTEWEQGYKVASFQFDIMREAFQQEFQTAQLEMQRQQQMFDQQYRQAMMQAEDEWRRWEASIKQQQLEMQIYEQNLRNSQIHAAQLQDNRARELAAEGARITADASNYHQYLEEWKNSSTGRASNNVARFFGVAPGSHYNDSSSIRAVQNISGRLSSTTTDYNARRFLFEEEEMNLFELSNVAELHMQQAQNVMEPWSPPERITHESAPSALVPQTERGDRMLGNYYGYVSQIGTNITDIEQAQQRFTRNSGAIIRDIGTELYERLMREIETKRRSALNTATTMSRLEADGLAAWE